MFKAITLIHLVIIIVSLISVIVWIELIGVIIHA